MRFNDHKLKVTNIWLGITVFYKTYGLKTYHTLSAVIRLASGLETSDFIESRSVRGTP